MTKAPLMAHYEYETGSDLGRAEAIAKAESFAARNPLRRRFLGNFTVWDGTDLLVFTGLNRPAGWVTGRTAQVLSSFVDSNHQALFEKALEPIKSYFPEDYTEALSGTVALHLPDPGSKFATAVADLALADSQFQGGKLSAVEHGDARGAALAGALQAVALEHGVELQLPLHIDSRGEVSIVAFHPDGRPSTMGSGTFGEAFAALLNGHSARTGAQPTGHFAAEEGWCRMRHLDVERLVLAYSSKVASLPDAAPPKRARLRA